MTPESNLSLSRVAFQLSRTQLNEAAIHRNPEIHTRSRILETRVLSVSSKIDGLSVGINLDTLFVSRMHHEWRRDIGLFITNI